MEKTESTQTIYPSIVFKVKGRLYAANSKYIATLLRLPKYETLPDAPPAVTGIFPYRGDMIEMFDLRLALGLPSLAQEYEQFADMLECRKQDHIRWVEELERSSLAGEPFQLATDPHKCAFGKWYDSFSSDNNAVNHHLKKIDAPHQALHRAALDVGNCSRDCDKCTRGECLQSILKRVREQSMPTILKLLEEAKEIFRSNLYHEMVLILSGDSRLGLVVDEVLSVEELSPFEDLNAVRMLSPSPMIGRVERSEKIPGMILELDIPALLESFGT